MSNTTFILLCILIPLTFAAQLPDPQPESTCEPEPISFSFNQFQGAECPIGKIGVLVTVKVTANCEDAIFEITVCRKEATNRLPFAVRKLTACVRTNLAICEDRINLQRCSQRRLTNCATKFIPA